MYFRSGTLTDLIRSAPSLPLWKCFGYFLLVAFGIELLVGVYPHLYQKLITLHSKQVTVNLCCPQVVSFFHRTMLTVGLAVLSLWPFLLGLFGKAKVTITSYCYG